MMSLQHPRLVLFIGAGEFCDPCDGSDTLFIVQEYMTGGSLDKRLWGTAVDSVTWHERLVWATDLAEAMAFIHHRGFTHRDLKSPNCLFCLQTGRAKVADFGTCRHVNAGSKEEEMLSRSRGSSSLSRDFKRATQHGLCLKEVMTTHVGTPQWLAPELCSVMTKIDLKLAAEGVEENLTFIRDHRRVEYGVTIDVYAFGVLLCELVTHRVPWEHMSPSDIFQNVSSGKRPWLSDCSVPAPAPSVYNSWCKLLTECWSGNPSNRPSFQNVQKQLATMKKLHELPPIPADWISPVKHDDGNEKLAEPEVSLLG